MSGEAIASSIYMAGMLVLVASAFAARRIPMKQTVKMALAWIAIFTLGFLLVGLLNQLRSGPTDTTPQVSPEAPPNQNFT